MNKPLLLLYGLFIAVYLVTCGNISLFAQGVTGPIGSKAWMMGGASASAVDLWSANNNPGAMGMLSHTHVGIYSEQRFMESNLKLANITGIYHNKWLNFGASVNYYGYQAFNQQKISLSAGKKLSSTVSLGVQLNYLATNIQDYGNAGAWALGAGLAYKPIEKLTFGLMVFNPTQSKYTETLNERIPTITRMGLTYKVSKKVMVQMEADQTLQQKLILRGGLEYQLHEILSLSAGAANNPVYYTFGASLAMKKLKLDMATSFHEVLGYSPHIGLVFPFK